MSSWIRLARSDFDFGFGVAIRTETSLIQEFVREASRLVKGRERERGRESTTKVRKVYI